MNIHHLHGCTPTPLAGYLKALGILRIIAEQADPEVRGWWQDEHFVILTTLDRNVLHGFLADRYAPTPFVSPWNKGSGFYANSDPGLSPIEGSTAPRLEAFRQGIAAARADLDAMAQADAAVRALKDRTKAKKGMTEAEKAAARTLKNDPEFKSELAAADKRFKELKADLFSPCNLRWRGAHRAWFDAAVVLQEDAQPVFPSLLGTGGNDGRLDFTNNAMQRIGELFNLAAPEAPATAEAHSLLTAAIFAETITGLSPKSAIGQFAPGQAGGANTTTGADGDSLINPWDFLLMLEGSVFFSGRSTRRLDPHAAGRASAPFAIRAQACGHGSAGDEKSERGEQWMPLWRQPTCAQDLHALIGESRLQIGRSLATRPIDAARAIANLGTARGITAFQRFGYLERNGQSNLATPLARIAVRERPQAHLIDDIAPWLDRLNRSANDKHAPARLVHAERHLADAVFAALTHDATAERWQAVLLAAQAVEAIQATGAAIKAGPIPALDPAWLSACDDGSAGWRLAMALGSSAAAYRVKKSRQVEVLDPIRHHWLPLQPGARRFDADDRHLRHDVRVVAYGRDALRDLAAVVERRLIEAARSGSRHLTLQAAPGYAARLGDLAELLNGKVDIERSVCLARALMALRWDRPTPRLQPSLNHGATPDPAWLALRLCTLAGPLGDDRTLPCDPAMIRRLNAGDSAGAVNIALRRLGATGIRPPMQAACVSPTTTRLWAAALAFPITTSTADVAVAILNPSREGALHA